MLQMSSFMRGADSTLNQKLLTLSLSSRVSINMCLSVAVNLDLVFVELLFYQSPFV